MTHDLFDMQHEESPRTATEPANEDREIENVAITPNQKQEKKTFREELISLIQSESYKRAPGRDKFFKIVALRFKEFERRYDEEQDSSRRARLVTTWANENSEIFAVQNFSKYSIKIDSIFEIQEFLSGKPVYIKGQIMEAVAEICGFELVIAKNHSGEVLFYGDSFTVMGTFENSFPDLKRKFTQDVSISSYTPSKKEKNSKNSADKKEKDKKNTATSDILDTLRGQISCSAQEAQQKTFNSLKRLSSLIAEEVQKEDVSKIEQQIQAHFQACQKTIDGSSNLSLSKIKDQITKAGQDIIKYNNYFSGKEFTKAITRGNAKLVAKKLGILGQVYTDPGSVQSMLKKKSSNDW